VSAVEAVLFLARCLSYDDSPSAVAALGQLIATGRIDWPTVADTANDHGITPAFWSALKRKGLSDLLPADLQIYLSMVLDLNRQRNRIIREQTVEVAAELNRRGIRPILLKGSMSLFEDGIDDGIRLMSDIDLLLQQSDLTAGFAVLRSMGYTPLGDAPRHTHGWAFHRPMSLVTIDVHRHVGPQRSLLTPATVTSVAVPLSHNGVELAGLCPTHQALLLVMTFGILERHYRNGSIPLKNMHDLATLIMRHGREIDWAALARTARAHGFIAPARALLYIGHRIVGTPLPAALGTTAMTSLHFRRCLLQLRVPALERTAHGWTWISWPFDRFRMDYRYACGVRGLTLNAARIRHAASILARHSPPAIRRRWTTLTRTLAV
jgi:hypothetical protein